MRVITDSLPRPDVERMKAAISRLGDRLADSAGGAIDDMTVDVRITGGSPGEQVRLQASIPSRGAADVSYVDELQGVSEMFTTAVPREELAALARSLDVDILTALPPDDEEDYVPDSLIGLVTIAAGESRITLLFPVDDGALPAGEETAMAIDPGNGPFVLRASQAPPNVRPALEQVAAVVNGLFQGRP